MTPFSNPSRTIEETVENDLCIGCGTCVSLCPERAIELLRNIKCGTYTPKIDKNRCSYCSTCYRVCPGHSLDFRQLNIDVFGKEPEDMLETILLGNHDSFYVGHSTDHDIRFNSSSGGLVTQLLIFALNQGIIDGALVTRMQKGSPLEPEPFLARTREDFIEASKSKYCPVPANIVLREILEEDGRYAVVGLPCHIHGIRKAERLNRRLREKIVLHLGLFCGGTHNFFATQVLLQKLNIRIEEVNSVSYRGNGWPGKIFINLRGGRHVTVPFLRYFDAIFAPRFFRPRRCNFCTDGVNELADISFGDAWLPEYEKTENMGHSLFIIRTETGKKLIHDALLHTQIEIKEIDLDKVMKSTFGMLMSKKACVKAYMSVAAKLQRTANPDINAKLVKSSSLAFVAGLLQFINSCIGGNDFGRRLLVYTPIVLLKVYQLVLCGIFRASYQK